MIDESAGTGTPSDPSDPDGPAPAESIGALAPPPPPPPPPSASMAAPPVAPVAPWSADGRPVRALRAPVAVVAVLAVLAVLGVFVWDGGDRPTSASPSGSGIGGGADDSASVGVPAGASGSYNGEPFVSVPEPPFDESRLAPVNGVAIPPTEYGATVAWRVAGGWEQQLAAYQQSFPVSGYELAEQRLTNGDGGGGWDVVVAAEGYQPASGMLYLGPDPQDPSSTIVEYGARDR